MKNMEARKQELHEQLYKNFYKNTKPKNIIDIELFDGDDSEVKEITKKFITYDWQELDQNFWEKEWVYTYFLTPEAYQYYLPSLIMCSIHDLPYCLGISYSALHCLCPRFYSLYHNDEDVYFEYQVSAFDKKQYITVCYFLELFLDYVVDAKHRAAQALRWRWNKYNTNAYKKCKKYYRALHNFTYPESTDPKTKDLVKKIHYAFNKTPYPGHMKLCPDNAMGDEPYECSVEFQGLNWRTIHPDLLNYQYSALSFLSNEGFRYFLPAFMMADIFNFDGNADPIFHLSYKKNFEKTKFEQFSSLERNAIISYLEFDMERDFYNRKTIENALCQYWLRK